MHHGRYCCAVLCYMFLCCLVICTMCDDIFNVLTPVTTLFRGVDALFSERTVYPHGHGGASELWTGRGHRLCDSQAEDCARCHWSVCHVWRQGVGWLHGKDSSHGCDMHALSLSVFGFSHHGTRHFSKASPLTCSAIDHVIM